MSSDAKAVVGTPGLVAGEVVVVQNLDQVIAALNTMIVSLNTVTADLTTVINHLNTIITHLNTIITSLNTLHRLIRWGKNLEPTWIHAAIQVAPGAGTALVTHAVTAGLRGYIYGFLASAQEANSFHINWTSGGVARVMLVVLGAAGSVEAEDATPINEGLPADAGTNITITNVTAAGVGMSYQGRLLIGEI